MCTEKREISNKEEKHRIGRLFVVVGPSGVGKGSILEKVFSETDKLVYSVSATTRKKREGEIDGKNYFFKTRDEFEQMIKNDEFLECAEFVGNLYGTPKKYVQKQLSEGKDVLLEIEFQGAEQINKKIGSEAIFIGIIPPSLEILEKRLLLRSTETPEQINKRIRQAKLEVEQIKESNFFDYRIINEQGRLDESVLEFISIIKEIRGKPVLSELQVK